MPKIQSDQNEKNIIMLILITIISWIIVLNLILIKKSVLSDQGDQNKMQGA